MVFLDESGFDSRRVIYSHDYNLKHHVPVISEPLSQSLLHSLDVQEIFVTQTVSQPRMHELLALAAAAGVRVSLVGAGHPNFAERCTSVQMMDGLMVTTFDSDGDHPLNQRRPSFSAGGHLSASLAIRHAMPVYMPVSPADQQDARPVVAAHRRRRPTGGVAGR